MIKDGAMRNIADSVPRVPLGYLQPEANTFPAYEYSMLKLLSKKKCQQYHTYVHIPVKHTTKNGLMESVCTCMVHVLSDARWQFSSSSCDSDRGVE